MTETKEALRFKEITMTFGEKVKALRLSKELTAKELGNRIGVSDRSITSYENGTRTPRAKVCEALAKELGVSVKELTDDSVDIPIEKSEKVKAPAEKPAKKVPTEEIVEKKAPTEETLKKESPAEKPTKNEKPASANEKAETVVKPQDFGQKLSELRTEKGLSQAKVAEQLGVTINVYRRMENKNLRPENKRAYNKLAKIFECDVSYLIEGDERYDKSVTKVITEKSAPAEVSVRQKRL